MISESSTLPYLHPLPWSKALENEKIVQRRRKDLEKFEVECIPRDVSNGITLTFHGLYLLTKK